MKCDHPLGTPIEANLSVTRTKPVIDFLIAKTHLSESDNKLPDCRITGPSLLDAAFASYQPTMVTSSSFSNFATGSQGPIFEWR